MTDQKVHTFDGVNTPSEYDCVLTTDGAGRTSAQTHLVKKTLEPVRKVTCNWLLMVLSTPQSWVLGISSSQSVAHSRGAARTVHGFIGK